MKEKYVCVICGKNFKLSESKNKLINHGKTHNPNYPEDRSIFMFHKAISYQLPIFE